MYALRLRPLLLSATLLVPVASAATAATISNADAKPVIVSVMENGNKSDVVIEPGATTKLCDAGCFLTLPNGDRIGLSGSETVKIVKGVAVIQ